MRISLKLITAIIILIVCQVTVAPAQPSRSTWLTTGIGFNSDWIINQNVYGNQELAYSTKFGFTANLGISHFIDREYGLSTGIGIITLGQNYHGEQGEAQATRKVNLNYIQVPLLAMRQLADPKHPCWLSVGPQLMFLTSARQVYSREDGLQLPNPEYLPEGTVDVAKWYKPFDVMLNVGVTNIYEMRTNDWMRMSLSFNGAFGLLDINAKEYQIPNIHETYKASHNFYLSAQIGLIFNP